jgi:uncharacterized membrane protein YqiK
MTQSKKVNLLKVLAEQAEREAKVKAERQAERDAIRDANRAEREAKKAEREAILQFLLAENARHKAEHEAERKAKAIKSETVYVSNEELGEPVYESRRVSTNAKIMRERMSGMKVGEYTNFPEFSFPEGDGRGGDKEVAKNRKLFQSEFSRIGKELGFKVQVRFSRTRGSKLTPSITIIEKRGS